MVRRQKTMTLTTTEESRPWSDLPVDSLWMIFKKLHFVDQIRCRAVCKNWHGVDNAPSIEKIPWIMRYKKDDDVSSCEITVQSSDQCCNDIISGPTFTIERQRNELEMEIFSGSELLASRKSWLLLRSRKKLLFMYNPFKKDIIKLPSLDIEDFAASLSETLSLSDCIVFVIERRPDSKINIRTCQCSDAAWNVYCFDSDLVRCSHVVYGKATFYCLFEHQKLGAYNPVNNEWSALIQIRPMHDILRNFMVADIREPFPFLVETGGEPLLVCYSYVTDKFYIFKFDPSKMAWTQENDLGNQIFFLDPSLISASYSISAAGETRNLANRVYCSLPFQYYSLETGVHYGWNKGDPEDKLMTRVLIQPSH